MIIGDSEYKKMPDVPEKHGILSAILMQNGDNLQSLWVFDQRSASRLRLHSYEPTQDKFEEFELPG